MLSRSLGPDTPRKYLSVFLPFIHIGSYVTPARKLNGGTEFALDGGSLFALDGGSLFALDEGTEFVLDGGMEFALDLPS
jgi:hypothetical protein